MHDGQNMFDDSTAANGEWHLDEVAEGLTDAKRIPPMIIVAVSVPPERRFEEYTPTPIQRPTPTGGTVSLGGRAELHAKMMVEEIKPFIDSTYRTLTDRANTALGGSSLGGLITLYTGAKYPKLFGTLFAISPSVWWDKKQILNILTKEAPIMRKSAKEPPRIWLDIGDQEGKEALEGARELKSLLLNKGWKAGTTLHFMEAPNAAHSESAWANRLEPMLTTMFGKNTQKK
jgi:predicted alpha/beta superfamily hydrolase